MDDNSGLDCDKNERGYQPAQQGNSVVHSNAVSTPEQFQKDSADPPEKLETQQDLEPVDFFTDGTEPLLAFSEDEREAFTPEPENGVVHMRYTSSESESGSQTGQETNVAVAMEAEEPVPEELHDGDGMPHDGDGLPHDGDGIPQAMTGDGQWKQGSPDGSGTDMIAAQEQKKGVPPVEETVATSVYEQVAGLDESDSKAAVAHEESSKKGDTDQKASASELPVISEDSVRDFRCWPPDIMLPAAKLNALLTCGLCSGYFVNASTVTECMHTFCRSCIVKHIHESLHCPRCLTLIHPSNPFVNLRADSTMQGILYNILPHLEKEEKDREIEFYKQRGLPYPVMKAPHVIKKAAKSRPARQPPKSKLRHVPVHLVNAGTSPGLPRYPSLKKKFLWLPDITSIGHIRKYVAGKLHPQPSTGVYLFIQAYLIHDSLRLQNLQDIFGIQNLQTRMIKIQYAVLPTRNYLRDGFSSLFPPRKSEDLTEDQETEGPQCSVALPGLVSVKGTRSTSVREPSRIGIHNDVGPDS